MFDPIYRRNAGNRNSRKILLANASESSGHFAAGSLAREKQLTAKGCLLGFTDAVGDDFFRAFWPSRACFMALCERAPGRGIVLTSSLKTRAAGQMPAAFFIENHRAARTPKP